MQSEHLVKLLLHQGMQVEVYSVPVNRGLRNIAFRSTHSLWGGGYFGKNRFHQYKPFGTRIFYGGFCVRVFVSNGRKSFFKDTFSRFSAIQTACGIIRHILE